MARAIDGDKLLEQLQKKKAGPANKRYTEGFNDCLMRVRSIVHSMPTLTALRPVSREHADKVWRGEWIPVEDNAFYNRCSKCGKIAIGKHSFCRNCGSPITDEAVQMVMERLEALKGV